MSENPDSSTICAERIPRAARTSTYVFLLHLCSPENAKNVERERERDRWDTLSVFTIGPRRLPGNQCMSPRVLLFPSTVSLDFFSFTRLFYGECFGSFLFGLPSFLPGGRGRQGWPRKFEESNRVIGYIILRENTEHVADTSDWCGWLIKAAPRLASWKFSWLNSTLRGKIA